jgi:hypothetical protein
MRRGDFAFFGAVSVPDATPEKLKTVVDWLHMMFVFDDRKIPTIVIYES